MPNPRANKQESRAWSRAHRKTARRRLLPVVLAGLALLANFAAGNLQTTPNAIALKFEAPAALAEPPSEPITSRPVVDRFDFVGAAALKSVSFTRRDPLDLPPVSGVLVPPRQAERVVLKPLPPQETIEASEHGRKELRISAPRVAGWSTVRTIETREVTTPVRLDTKKSYSVSSPTPARPRRYKSRTKSSKRPRMYRSRTKSSKTRAPKKNLYRPSRSWKARALFPG